MALTRINVLSLWLVLVMMLACTLMLGVKSDKKLTKDEENQILEEVDRLFEDRCTLARAYPVQYYRYYRGVVAFVNTNIKDKDEAKRVLKHLNDPKVSQCFFSPLDDRYKKAYEMAIKKEPTGAVEIQPVRLAEDRSLYNQAVRVIFSSSNDEVIRLNADDADLDLWFELTKVTHNRLRSLIKRVSEQKYVGAKKLMLMMVIFGPLYQDVQQGQVGFHTATTRFRDVLRESVHDTGHAWLMAGVVFHLVVVGNQQGGSHSAEERFSWLVGVLFHRYRLDAQFDSFSDITTDGGTKTAYMFQVLTQVYPRTAAAAAGALAKPPTDWEVITDVPVVLRIFMPYVRFRVIDDQKGKVHLFDVHKRVNQILQADTDGFSTGQRMPSCGPTSSASTIECELWTELMVVLTPLVESVLQPQGQTQSNPNNLSPWMATVVREVLTWKPATSSNDNNNASPGKIQTTSDVNNGNNNRVMKTEEETLEVKTTTAEQLKVQEERPALIKAIEYITEPPPVVLVKPNLLAIEYPTTKSPWYSWPAVLVNRLKEGEETTTIRLLNVIPLGFPTKQPELDPTTEATIRVQSSQAAIAIAGMKATTDEEEVLSFQTASSSTESLPLQPQPQPQQPVVEEVTEAEIKLGDDVTTVINNNVISSSTVTSETSEMTTSEKPLELANSYSWNKTRQCWKGMSKLNKVLCIGGPLMGVATWILWDKIFNKTSITTLNPKWASGASGSAGTLVVSTNVTQPGDSEGTPLVQSAHFWLAIVSLIVIGFIGVGYLVWSRSGSAAGGGGKEDQKAKVKSAKVSTKKKKDKEKKKKRKNRDKHSSSLSSTGSGSGSPSSKMATKSRTTKRQQSNYANSPSTRARPSLVSSQGGMATSTSSSRYMEPRNNSKQIKSTKPKALKPSSMVVSVLEKSNDKGLKGSSKFVNSPVVMSSNNNKGKGKASKTTMSSIWPSVNSCNDDLYSSNYQTSFTSTFSQAPFQSPKASKPNVPPLPPRAAQSQSPGRH